MPPPPSPQAQRKPVAFALKEGCYAAETIFPFPPICSPQLSALNKERWGERKTRGVSCQGALWLEGHLASRFPSRSSAAPGEIGKSATSADRGPCGAVSAQPRAETCLPIAGLVVLAGDPGVPMLSGGPFSLFFLSPVGCYEGRGNIEVTLR